MCLVHTSSLSIHEMDEGLLSSIKPDSFPLCKQHLPDAGGRCVGFRTKSLGLRETASVIPP